jgi:hypothetical protein
MKGSLQMKMTWKDIRVVGILFFFSCLAVPIKQDVLKMKKLPK